MSAEVAPEESSSNLAGEETEEAVESAPVADDVADAADDPAPEPDWSWDQWDMEQVDSVPDAYRDAAGTISGKVKALREALEQRIEEIEGRAKHHQELWERVLRDEQPEAFGDYQRQIEDLKLKIANKDKILSELTKDRDHYKTNFEDHVTQSNDQYLSWVEAKHKERLIQDRDNNGSAVLLSAQDLVVELQFDPDDALTLGFEHGLEAMAVAADLCQKGLPPAEAMDVVKKLHPAGAHIPAPEPEPEPEPAPEPAKHSPSADVVEDGDLTPRGPERNWNTPSTRPNLWGGDRSLDDFLTSAVSGLFK